MPKYTKKGKSAKSGAVKASKKARVPQYLPDGSQPISAPTHLTVRVGPPSPSPPLATVSQSPVLTSLPEEPIGMDVTLATEMTASRGGLTFEAASPSVAAVSSTFSRPLGVTAATLSQAAAGHLTPNQDLAIIHTQQRKISRLTNNSLEGQMIRIRYPIPRPVIEEGSDFKIPCARLVLGLKYYDDGRGTINRHIWNDMQSIARAVIASARLLNTLNDKLNYKKLLTERKDELRDQLKGLFIQKILIREVLFVNGDTNRPKFFEEWPLDKMLITATASERATFKAKEEAMKSMETMLLKFRVENEGRPSWLGKEQILVKKIVGATRGRPSLKKIQRRRLQH